MVDGDDSVLSTAFTHHIPEGPALVSPEDGASGLDPGAIVVSWNPVSEDILGQPVDIVGYQVIVEEGAPEGLSGRVRTTRIQRHPARHGVACDHPRGIYEGRHLLQLRSARHRRER
jgi:hypothetical protein